MEALCGDCRLLANDGSMALRTQASRCCVCGGQLGATDKVRGFPPFVVNRLDALAIFSDGLAHELCLDSHPLRELLGFELHRLEASSERRECLECGLRVDSPSISGLACISSDSDDAISEYNYSWIHESCVGGSEQFLRFRKLFAKMDGEGRFDGLRYAPWTIAV
jgi:hypothetical protein